jgi:hypothetical protein
MRKLLLTATALVALAGAGLAYAHSTGSSVTSVAATFNATTVSHSEQQSCTTTDNNTIQMTSATYTGTAVGDVSLAGTVTMRTRSVIDTSDDLGTVQGSVRIGNGDAQFSGVYDHGKVAGLLTGHVGAKDAHAALLANVSASFSTSGGFSGGKIGASDGGSAVELSAGQCKPASDSKKHAGKKGHGKGRDSSHG